MESRYLEGKNIPEFDHHISCFVEEQGVEGGGKTMIIAVENFDKEIYRVIRCWGLGEFIHATQFLGSLGLEDVLRNNPNGENGLDCRFVAPTGLRQKFIARSISTEQDPINEVLEASSELAELTETERESVVKSRIGQGFFREKLIEYWHVCAVTGLSFVPLLRASHIKPWKASTNVERLDVYNGLLLAPHVDAAFDAGHITFDENGRIMFSAAFRGEPAYAMRIGDKLKIDKRKLKEEHAQYLAYHRNNVFLGG